MSSGFTWHGEHAVALAETDIELMPMIRPNHVGTTDWEDDRDAVYAAVTAIAARDAGEARRLRGRDCVVDSVDCVLAARRGAELLRDGLGHHGVRQVLDSCQRGRVDARLQLPLHEHRVPDVDNEADAAEQEHHRDRGDDEDLAAFVRRARHASTPSAAAVGWAELHSLIYGTVRGTNYPPVR